MTLPQIVASDWRCQDVKMQMVIMMSVSKYDVTQAELLFLINCGIF